MSAARNIGPSPDATPRLAEVSRRGIGAARLRRALAVALALLAVFLIPGRDVGAQSCAPERDRPTVLVVWRILGRYSPDTADLLATNLTATLAQRVPEVRWVRLSELQQIAGFQVDREALGGAPAQLSEFLGLIGTPFVLDLLCSEVSGGRGVMTATLAATDTQTTLHRAERRYPIRDPGQALDQIQTMVLELAPANLLCELVERRDRPAVPALTLQVTPQEVVPGATVRVRARLTDASTGAAQPNKQVRIVHEHGLTELSSLSYRTDQDGVVLQDLTASSQPGRPSVEATYTGLRGRTKRSSPRTVRYRVRNVSGDLTISAPQASLNVGGADTVTTRLQRAGAPVAGASITVAATDGSVGSPSVTTGADGTAVTTYQAPTSNTVVDVTATTPAPPSKGPRAAGDDLTATLTYVVDAGVTLSLTTSDTAGGTAAPVAADLLAGGRPLAATDVTFSLAGAGALSAASAPTNAAGRAEVLWLPPAGSSTATITAEAVVDGRRYTQTAGVSASPAGGAVVVRAIPRAANGKPTAIFLESGTGCGEVVATLGGVYVCPTGPFDYGTTREAPVTVRAETSGTYFQIGVTRTASNVAVVEFIGAPESVDVEAEAVVELELPSAGTIDVAVDLSGAPATPDYLLNRPTDGGMFVLGEPPTRVLQEPEVAAAIDVAAAGPLQLGFSNFRTPGIRFTLTFRAR